MDVSEVDLHLDIVSTLFYEADGLGNVAEQDWRSRGADATRGITGDPAHLVQTAQAPSIGSRVIALMPPPILHTLSRTTPSIAPIAHRGILSINGSQSTEFLNGLLASSVRKPAQSQFSAILHPQARTLVYLSPKPS